MKPEEAASRLAYTLEDQERMTRARNYFAWQSRLVLPELGRRVIEVGCGIGNFTEKLLDRELVVAVDEEPGCVDRLRERFPHQPNLRTAVLDAGCRLSDLASYRPDSCVCLNVLEHIEDDLGTLRGMAAILPAGGRAVLIVPAFQALYGPIDRNLAHQRRYDRASISRVARAAGFEVRQAHYMNVPGFFGWWINAHVLKRSQQSAAQIAFFDRFIVPAISRMERLAPPPFGQSLFCVLEKPG